MFLSPSYSFFLYILKLCIQKNAYKVYIRQKKNKINAGVPKTQATKRTPSIPPNTPVHSSPISNSAPSSLEVTLSWLSCLLLLDFSLACSSAMWVHISKLHCSVFSFELHKNGVILYSSSIYCIHSTCLQYSPMLIYMAKFIFTAV